MLDGNRVSIVMGFCTLFLCFGWIWSVREIRGIREVGKVLCTENRLSKRGAKEIRDMRP